MEKLFHGVMKAAHLRRAQKLKVIDMMEQSGRDPHRADEVKAMIMATLPYWLRISHSSIDNVEICMTIFRSWSTNNLHVMSEAIATELPVMIKEFGHDMAVNHVCNLISVCLAMLSTCADGNLASPQGVSSVEVLNKPMDQSLCLFDGFVDAMESVTGELLSHTNSMASLSCLSSFLLEHPKVIRYESAVSLVRTLVAKQSSFIFNINVDNPKEFMHEANKVTKLIKHLWDSSESYKMIVLESLKVLFGIVSSTKELDSVSVALSSVLQTVREPMIEDFSMNLISDPSVNDDQITNALRHMVDWLKWPRHVTLHTWIIIITHGLVQNGRLNILFGITDEMAASITSKLAYGHIQSTSMQVLKTFLLFHQRCPQAFHKCIPVMMVVFDQIEDDAVRIELSELIQVMVYMHPGYPDLYHNLLAKLSGYQALSESCMQDIVSKYSVHTTKSPRYSVSTASQFRKEGAMVGLDNLGNTCFLNAVVQALYNVDAFKSSLLSAQPSPVSMLNQLQRVFAFLQMTRSASANPESYVKASLPDWFILGEQQDSSEYLRFLLDSIYEQFGKLQGPQQNDVTSQFIGSDVMMTRCHNCSAESSTKQKFWDISLHFPEGAANQPLTLEHMLDNALKPEELTGPNQFYCEKCECLQDATRKPTEMVLPACLVLTLCRFSYNKKLGKNKKLRTVVSYPETLEIQDKNYRLNAVIVHSGVSLNAGHYYTYAHSMALPDQWYLFNDVRVTSSASPTAAHKNSRLSSDTPYILFYTDTDTSQVARWDNSMICPSLQHVVIKDDMQMEANLRVAQKKKTSRKQTCQTNTLSWCNYTDDDDLPPPGADNSMDLSGSRFIY